MSEAPTTTDTTVTETPANMGDGGKAAIQAERARRALAETALALVSGKSKTEIDRMFSRSDVSEDSVKATFADLAAQHEQTIAEAQAATAAASESVPALVAEQLKTHLVALHGISDEDSELFLTATDPETLVKQVSRLVAQSATAAELPAAPRPDLTQGGSGAPLALNSDGLEDALRSKLGI